MIQFLLPPITATAKGITDLLRWFRRERDTEILSPTDVILGGRVGVPGGFTEFGGP